MTFQIIAHSQHIRGHKACGLVRCSVIGKSSSNGDGVVNGVALCNLLEATVRVNMHGQKVADCGIVDGVEREPEHPSAQSVRRLSQAIAGSHAATNREAGMAETRAEKVQWLFANVPDPQSGELFSIPRAAAKMRELGYDLSDNTLRNVFSGDVERPSYEVLEGVAKIFGVSPAFFSADASIADLQQQLTALATLVDAHVWHLAQRAVGVSPEGVDVALAVLEHYRTRQGLNERSQDENSPAKADSVRVAGSDEHRQGRGLRSERGTERAERRRRLEPPSEDRSEGGDHDHDT